MKHKTKNIIGITAIAVLAFSLFSFSCNKTTVASKNSGQTVFADESPAVALPKDGLY